MDNTTPHEKASKAQQPCGEGLPVMAMVDKWTPKLEGVNVPQPKVSVQRIIASVLGYQKIHDVSEERILDENQIARIAEMCTKCYEGVPAQYITEEWEFNDLTLKIRPPVFIIRPWGQALAKLAYDEMKTKQDTSKTTRILELGSGCGAISVYLLNKLPQAVGVAVDYCSKSCALTKENAQLIGVETRLTTLQLDYTRPESWSTLMSHGLYDLVVANPPYIRTDEMKDMEVFTKYEDPLAFHGGDDGLYYVRIILSKSAQLLKPGCALWLEVGTGHCDSIRSEITKQPNGLHFCSAFPDFNNSDRFCVLRTKESSN